MGWDDVWAALYQEPTPHRPSADPSVPYEGLAPGTKVWSEEELQNSLGADSGLWGTAARAIQFDLGTPAFQALSNTVTDMWDDPGRYAKEAATSPLSPFAGIAASKSFRDKFKDNLSEAMHVFAGVGHKDPETGQITGQAEWKPGHADLGTKTEFAFMQPGDGQKFVEDAIPGGVLLKLLPDDLRTIPGDLLEPVMRTGLRFAGNILESPGAMAAMGGSGIIRGLVAGKSTFLKGAYVTSELAQKAAGMRFIGEGAISESRLAKQAYDKGDARAFRQHAAQAVANVLLGALMVKGAKTDIGDVRAKPAAAAASAAADTGLTYHGRPVRIAGVDKGQKRVTVFDAATGEKLGRKYRSQIQGLEAPKAEEAMKAPPGDQFPTEGTEAEKQAWAQRQEGAGAIEMGAERTKAPTPEEIAPLLDRVTKRLNEVGLGDRKLFFENNGPEAGTAYFATRGPRTGAIVINLDAVGADGQPIFARGAPTIIRTIAHELAHPQDKLVQAIAGEAPERAGAAFTITGQRLGKNISQSGGHSMGFNTDLLSLDAQHLLRRTEIEDELLADPGIRLAVEEARIAANRAAAKAGGTPPPVERAAYSQQALDFAREVHGPRVTQDEFGNEIALMQRFREMPSYGDEIEVRPNERPPDAIQPPPPGIPENVVRKFASRDYEQPAGFKVGEEGGPRKLQRGELSREKISDTEAERIVYYARQYKGMSRPAAIEASVNKLRAAGIEVEPASIRKAKEMFISAEAAKGRPVTAVSGMSKRLKAMEADASKDIETQLAYLRKLPTEPTDAMKDPVIWAKYRRARESIRSRLDRYKYSDPAKYIQYKEEFDKLTRRPRGPEATRGKGSLRETLKAPRDLDAVELRNEIRRLLNTDATEARAKLTEWRSKNYNRYKRFIEKYKDREDLRGYVHEARNRLRGQEHDEARLKRLVSAGKKEAAKPKVPARRQAAVPSKKIAAPPSERSEAAELARMKRAEEEESFEMGRERQLLMGEGAQKAKDQLGEMLSNKDYWPRAQVLMKDAAARWAKTGQLPADLRAEINDLYRQFKAEAVAPKKIKKVEVEEVKVQPRKAPPKPTEAELRAAEQTVYESERKKFVPPIEGEGTKGGQWVPKEERPFRGEIKRAKETVARAEAEERRAVPKKTEEAPKHIKAPPKEIREAQDVVGSKGPSSTPLRRVKPFGAKIRARLSAGFLARVQSYRNASAAMHKLRVSLGLKQSDVPLTSIDGAIPRLRNLLKRHGVETQDARGVMAEVVEGDMTIKDAIDYVDTQAKKFSRMHEKPNMRIRPIEEGEGRPMPHAEGRYKRFYPEKGAAPADLYGVYDKAGKPIGHIDYKKAYFKPTKGEPVSLLHRTVSEKIPGKEAAEYLTGDKSMRAFKKAVLAGNVGVTKKYHITIPEHPDAMLRLTNADGDDVFVRNGREIDTETLQPIPREEKGIFGAASEQQKIKLGVSKHKSRLRAASMDDEQEVFAALTKQGVDAAALIKGSREFAGDKVREGEPTVLRADQDDLDEALVAIADHVDKKTKTGETVAFYVTDEEVARDMATRIDELDEGRELFAKEALEKTGPSGVKAGIADQLSKADLIDGQGGRKVLILTKQKEPGFDKAEFLKGRKPKDIRQPHPEFPEETEFVRTEEVQPPPGRVRRKKVAGAAAYTRVISEPEARKTAVFGETYGKHKKEWFTRAETGPKRRSPGIRFTKTGEEVAELGEKPSARLTAPPGAKPEVAKVEGKARKIPMTPKAHPESTGKGGPYKPYHVLSETIDSGAEQLQSKPVRRVPRINRPEQFRTATEAQVAAWYKATHTGKEFRDLEGWLPRKEMSPAAQKAHAELNKIFEDEGGFKMGAEVEKKGKKKSTWINPKEEQYMDKALARGAWKNAMHGVEISTDVANVARAAASSMDFSAPLRQTAILTATVPGRKARLWNMVRAWAQKNHDVLMKDMMADPEFKSAQKHGMNFVLHSGEHEAFYASPRLEKGMSHIPGGKKVFNATIGGSERAYTYFQNASMMDAWKHGKDYLQGLGAWNKATKLELAEYINDAAARSPLGSTKRVSKARKVLTATFFSPQLIASRAKLLVDAGAGFGRYNTHARRYARMQTYKAIGYGAAMMMTAYAGMMAMGEDPEIEWDPRSTDFGKVRTGRTTFDPWAGWQQFVRLTAQLITGKMKRVSSGRVSEIQKLDVFTRFLRSKLAPGPAMLVSMMEGQDPIGRETSTPKGVARMVGEQALPLAARDLKDLYEENPLHAVIYAIPVMLGASVNSGIGRREWLAGSVKEDEAKVSKEIKDLRLNPPKPGRRVSLRTRNVAGEKEYKSLTPAEYEAFEKTVMPEIYSELRKYIESPSYQRMSKQQRVRALNRRIRFYNRTKSAQRMVDPRQIESKVRNRYWEDWEE